MQQRLKYLFLIMVLFFCSKPCLGEEYSPSTLTIEVRNGTANGAAVTGDEISVAVYHHAELLKTLDSKVRVDGKVVFEDVPADDHVVAVARVKHQDMMFSSKAIGLSSGRSKHNGFVQVFDVSNDQSKLSITTHHFIIKIQGGALQITEYMQIKNSYDKAISSKDSAINGAVLEQILPLGFKNLQYLTYFEKNAIVVTDEGFYDTMGVPPGEFHAGFSYTLDIDSKIMDISKKFSLPTSSFMVFAELGQVQLQGLGSPSNRATGSNGVPINYYRMYEISPGQEIKFQLAGFNVDTTSRTEWIISAAVFGGVLVLVLFKLYTKRDVTTDS